MPPRGEALAATVCEERRLVAGDVGRTRRAGELCLNGAGAERSRAAAAGLVLATATDVPKGIAVSRTRDDRSGCQCSARPDGGRVAARWLGCHWRSSGPRLSVDEVDDFGIVIVQPVELATTCPSFAGEQ